MGFITHDDYEPIQDPEPNESKPEHWTRLKKAKDWTKHNAGYVSAVTGGLVAVVLIGWMGSVHQHRFAHKPKAQPTVQTGGKVTNPPTSGAQTASVPQAEDQFLFVNWGDTLSQLAVDIFRSADYHRWYEYNPKLPEDPRDLREGVWLFVPARYAENIPTNRIVVPYCFALPSDCDASGHSEAAAFRGAGTRTAARARMELASIKATGHVSLETAHADLDGLQLGDPPIVNLPLTAYAMAATAPAVTAIPLSHIAPATPATVPASLKVQNRKRMPKRGSKGYAIAVTPDMGMETVLDPTKVWRPTMLVTQNEDGTFNRTWLKGNSKVLLGKKDAQYVLYVPVQELPAEPYWLLVGGFNDPISGREFSRNASPITKGRFPKPHALWGELFAGGGAAGMGARAFAFGAAPVVAGAVSGGVLIAHFIGKHHEAKQEARNRAAESQLIGAKLALISTQANLEAHQDRAP